MLHCHLSVVFFQGLYVDCLFTPNLFVIKRLNFTRLHSQFSLLLLTLRLEPPRWALVHSCTTNMFTLDQLFYKLSNHHCFHWCSNFDQNLQTCSTFIALICVSPVSPVETPWQSLRLKITFQNVALILYWLLN